MFPGAKINTGDFDNNGADDILVRHLDGNVSIVLMANGGQVERIDFGNPTNDWQIAGVGDFNYDSYDDILWRHTNGSRSG